MRKISDNMALSMLNHENIRSVRASTQARYWLKQRPVFVCIHSSGSDQLAQVIEVAVLDTDQSVLLHSKIRPSVLLDRETEQRTGLNMSSLQGRDTWLQVAEFFRKQLINRPIIMFDELFEKRILKQSCQAYAMADDWLDALEVNCAMHLAVKTFGCDNRYGTCSLHYALQKSHSSEPLSVGSEIADPAIGDSAIGDAYALVSLIDKLVCNASARQKDCYKSLREAV